MRPTRRSIVTTLDLKPVKLDDPTGRIRIYDGMQHYGNLLDRIARETAPQGLT
jgi:hypothetical protein